MQTIRITMCASSRKELEGMLHKAQYRGDLRAAKRIMAVLASVDGHRYSSISRILQVSDESIRLCLRSFLLHGSHGLLSRKPPGRKPKLTKSQRKELDEVITKGPSDAGYPGACWRSPMIQHLIHERFGIFCSVTYIILIQDGARYHTSKAMQEFFAAHVDRLSVHQLPSYSPDYNPIEKLWKEIKKDGIHLHYFPTFDHLVSKVREVLPLFENAPEKVLSLFGFYKDLDVQLENAATGSIPADVAAEKVIDPKAATDTVEKAAAGKEINKASSLKESATKEAKDPAKSVEKTSEMKPATDTKPASLPPAKTATEKATEKK